MHAYTDTCCMYASIKNGDDFNKIYNLFFRVYKNYIKISL